MLKRWLMVGILIATQGCAGTNLNPFEEKPYFASPPAQVSRADKDLFDRALFRQTNNRIQPAIKVWGQFLEKYPRSFEAHNNLGLVYFEDDQLDAAIVELETAMSLEPSEVKIKNNLIRTLKFKSILFKEARDYNQAVDTLKRVQEISTPEDKEKVGYRIEQYEDKVFEQAKRINTLEAYQAFLIRFPKSSKNSDAARMKVEGMKPMEAVMPEKKATMMAPPKEPPAGLVTDGTNTENVLLEGSLMEKGNKENMEGVTSKVKDLTEKKMESAVTPPNPPLGEDSVKKVMEKKEAMAVEMADKTQPVVKSLDNGFIPVQPLEVPRSAEQKIEIATQPEPKPATGVNLFTKPIQKDPPEIAKAPQKKVKIATNNDPLRVREDPTSDSRILATVSKGSLVPLIKEENGWYKIEFSQGQMGWISKRYSHLVE